MTHSYRSVVCLVIALIMFAGHAAAQDAVTKFAQIPDSLLQTGLRKPQSYDLLRELTSKAPHRLSGSTGAANAVQLMKSVMEREGFSNVRLEQCMVPHWERGPVESAEIVRLGGKNIRLNICALGGSIATPRGGITAEVVEVHSVDEVKALGDLAKGKIVFFNRAFDPAKFDTFEGYSGAVDQRAGGAVNAARAGGVAALVRSMTTALDDVPHTGGMGYQDTVTKVPGAAISTMGANRLSALLKKDPHLKLRIVLTCRTFPDTTSSNVMGEITGSERPDEVIVVGGHLDCWDKGSGAHDDGSGCVQAIEVLKLIRELGLTPKRTIRAVLFMNEENGLRGGRAYEADLRRKSERQIAAIESDRGGFAPRGFSIQGDSLVVARVLRWRALFDRIDAGKIQKGGSGVDISPMVRDGVPGFGPSRKAIATLTITIRTMTRSTR